MDAGAGQSFDFAAPLTDALIGVDDRRALDMARAQQVLLVARQGHRLSLLILDLDHFKRVNHRWGHPAGDRVLAQTGALLRRWRRPGRHRTDQCMIIAPPPSTPVHPDADSGGVMPQPPARALPAVEAAWLFVSNPAGPAAGLPGLLAATLQRLGVQAGQQRVEALLDEPALGRQYRVRATPCLLLDTGARQVQLPGDPGQLDAARLEDALSRH